MAKSRQAERIRGNDEGKKDFIKLLKNINKRCPNLFKSLNGNDPRDQRYVTYSMRFLLTVLFFKCISMKASMRGMHSCFENTTTIVNLAILGGMKELAKLPCINTINNFLKKLPVSFLESVRKQIIYTLIRSKILDSGRFIHRFNIIVDASQTYGGEIPINDRCLKRVYNRGKENEYTTYHRNVLEAKLWVVGTPFVFSICSVFIENDPGACENDKRGKDQIKQDCELAAFKRLAEKLHSDFPRLPIIISGDALYISNNVFSLCNDYGWKFIIRYKEGAASTIQEYVDVAIQEGDLVRIPDQKEYKNAGYYTDVPYHGRTLNYIQATVVDPKKKPDEMKWVTDIDLKYNVEYILGIIRLGRGRWKIENQGFNRQKHWIGILEHLCCWEDQALKNHYLMIQIADIFLTLMEMEEHRQNSRESYRNPEFKPITRTFVQRSEDLRQGLSSILIEECDSWNEICKLVEEQSAA